MKLVRVKGTKVGWWEVETHYGYIIVLWWDGYRWYKDAACDIPLMPDEDQPVELGKLLWDHRAEMDK